MALQAARIFGSRSGITPGDVVDSALASPNIYWSEPQEPPLPEWEKWLDLFFVAMITKDYLFSLN